ncbi:hypothetical protein PROFUN_05235 [Planoprotostelium fungivorum]|uniref:N-acetyltransferase domain-containing protein n=1 Tax=Planoprotostelium fungivorum TaxID=1890364 RepID=A0A2P6NRL6_9EUKA|nr:hypothetical protein PROFUN_05235 [Planoprotostelium fungivorum]
MPYSFTVITDFDEATAQTILAIERSTATPGLGRLLWPGLHGIKTPAMVIEEEKTGSASSSQESLKQGADDREVRDTIDNMKNPNNSYIAMIDDTTNEIVGYAWWQFNESHSPLQWLTKYNTRSRPKEINVPLADAIGGVRTLKRAIIIGQRPWYHLRELYVLSDHREKGLGTRLVDWGLDEARRRGILAYVDAMPKAFNLYVRCGFTEIDRVTVDLELFGGERGQESVFSIMTTETTSS